MLLLSITEWRREAPLSFVHEKLQVYQKGLEAFTAVAPTYPVNIVVNYLEKLPRGLCCELLRMHLTT